jgi:threonine/homoserine/homoserine lactone efflux protein
MLDVLPHWPLLGAFIAASLVLAVTPGPGVIYIVARSLAQGRRCGLASVAGVALGNFGNALGASLGLAALFAVSSAAFTVVKWVGAAYLVWLGIQALRAPRADSTVAVPGPAPLRRVFRDGVIVSLLNPKTTIFFAAFLPQFVAPGASVVAQTLLLGALFVAIAAASDSVYAWLAGSVAPRLAGPDSGWPRWGRWLSAGAYIGLGVLTALAEQRPAASEMRRSQV